MMLSMAHPKIYLFTQGILGAIRARRLAMAEYVQFFKGNRILDIGCGPGYVSQYFPDTQYIGFDTEQSYIDYANYKYGHIGKFYCSEFDDNSVSEFEPFDIVIMNGLLHHLPDAAILKLFRSIKGVLKPEGKLVTLDCYSAEGQNRFVQKLLKMDRGKYIRLEEDYVKLASSLFNSVKSNIRDDLMYIPYPLVILQIT